MYSLFDSFFAPPTILVVSEERLKEAEKKQKQKQLDSLDERIKQLTEYRAELAKDVEPQSSERRHSLVSRTIHKTDKPVTLEGFQAILAPSKFGYSLAAIVDSDTVDKLETERSEVLKWAESKLKNPKRVHSNPNHGKR